MKSIVVVGSANIDLVIKSKRLPSPGETLMGGDLVQVFGGKGANQAISAARLGGRVEFVGKLGSDDFGEQYLRHLNAEGIQTRFVSRDQDRPNGCAMILLDDGGENMIVVSPGANMALTIAQVDAAACAIREAGAVVVQFEIPMPCIRRTLEIARKADVPIIVNPSPINLEFRLEGNPVTYLVANEGECATLSGLPKGDAAAFTALLNKGVQHLVVTRGAKDTVIATRESLTYVPAMKVEPVDTVGAGDTFAGAFAVAITEGKSLAEAVAFANIAAAIATTRLGAQTSMPSRAEVAAFLSTRT